MKKKSRRFRRIIALLVLIAIIATLAFTVSYVKNYIEKAMYPIEYNEYIKKYSDEFDLDPWLVLSVIWVESKFDTHALSSKDARGLMQITPQTGKWAFEKLKLNGYEDDLLYDPETNIRIGCWYLNNLRTEFNGDISLVIAAYNGGSGNVSKWLKDSKYSEDGETLNEIPFPETKNYVDRVFNTYDKYKEIYEKDNKLNFN